MKIFPNSLGCNFNFLSTGRFLWRSWEIRQWIPFELNEWTTQTALDDNKEYFHQLYKMIRLLTQFFATSSISLLNSQCAISVLFYVHPKKNKGHTDKVNDAFLLLRPTGFNWRRSNATKKLISFILTVASVIPQSIRRLVSRKTVWRKPKKLFSIGIQLNTTNFF